MPHNQQLTTPIQKMACFCSCIWGNPDPGPVRLQEVQQVVIDTTRMGEYDIVQYCTQAYVYDFKLFYYTTGVDCVVVKSGRRVCGTGGALANAPIVQDKSYFEVKIQCGGQEM